MEECSDRNLLSLELRKKIHIRKLSSPDPHSSNYNDHIQQSPTKKLYESELPKENCLADSTKCKWCI